MNSWKIILAALVIFGAGVMAGTLVATHHSLATPENPNSQQSPEGRDHPRDIPRPPLVDILSKKFLQQLNDKLQLSPEQYTNIQKIISEGQEKNHAIWTNCAPQMREVIMETHKQIKEQLTADQKEKFEDLLKQLRPPRKQNSTNAPPKIMPTTISTNASLAVPIRSVPGRTMPAEQIILSQRERAQAENSATAALFPSANSSAN